MAKKVTHEVAPRIRATFLRALDTLSKRKNKPTHEIMADWLEADPIRMMQAISRFLPREVNTTVENKTLGEVLRHMSNTNQLKDVNGERIHDPSPNKTKAVISEVVKQELLRR